MQDQIITVYVLCDDFLKSRQHKDDRQAVMTMAEVMTTALVSALLFKNCLEAARIFLKEHGYIKSMLSESRLNRRIHAVGESNWQSLFQVLADFHHAKNDELNYIVDSFPIQICDNYRIPRCKLYAADRKAFRGYIASKRRYFYGLRAHMITTEAGKPVELILAPASTADISGFKQLYLDLPPGSTIYADKAYMDYVCEDVLNEDTDITLVALHRANSTRPMDGCLRYICHHYRKRIETAFSRMADFFAKRIYAITRCGVELKICWAALALSIDCLSAPAG